MSGQPSSVEPIHCFALGHNAEPYVRLETATPQS